MREMKRKEAECKERRVRMKRKERMWREERISFGMMEREEEKREGW